jgi:2-keto-4-pentenoate hydratase/2-oxohepta-3-ene-1,7-dioic acid hydratase in catechol pathway
VGGELNVKRKKFASFYANGRKRFGVVTDKGLIDISERYSKKWLSLQEMILEGNLQNIYEEIDINKTDYNFNDVRFEIPIQSPEKIICVGVNYPARNEEYKDGQKAPEYPSLFVRFPGSFSGHLEPIIRPCESEKLDYEGEVVLVIGKKGRRIPEKDALDYVAAVSLCNEGTIRDWVRHAKFNVTQGKNFDKSGSMGPWIVPFENEEQIADIRLTTTVNGEIRQDDRTGRMLFSFRRIINYISTFTTLTEGDIIVTGTPAGAGARFDPPVWLKPGDVVEVEAEGIGRLRNTIEDEKI